jgi:cysteinyl-tRNA synthetase
MQFDSPWGRGFPGWHIECSAMAKKHLGEQIDIHTGGEDNIFPHHECEIAQSESANGKPFSRLWMHARHLMWDGKKMSKSEGTFFTIQMLLDKGYSGLVLRHALVATHYRMQVNYRLESFDDARKNIARLNDFRRRLQRDSLGADGSGDASDTIAKHRAAFKAAMDDDLNNAGALGAVHEFVTDVNRRLDLKELSAAGAAKALETLRAFDSVFAFLEPDAEAPAAVRDLVEKRAAARAAKNFKESDRLRDEIKRLGWIVEDGKAGQTVKKS